MALCARGPAHPFGMRDEREGRVGDRLVVHVVVALCELQVLVDGKNVTKVVVLVHFDALHPRMLRVDDAHGLEEEADAEGSVTLQIRRFPRHPQETALVKPQRGCGKYGDDQERQEPHPRVRELTIRHGAALPAVRSRTARVF